MSSTTHTPQATDWPNAGDPSVPPPTQAYEHVKLSGPATSATLDVVERLSYWFRDNFSPALRPEVFVDPNHRGFVTLAWVGKVSPHERTRMYAQGVVAGFLVASGHDVV